MPPYENLQGCENAAQPNALASAATDAYNPKDLTYCVIFTNKATPDSTKTDAALNEELHNCPPAFPFDQHNDSGGGLKDIQQGIKGDNTAKNDLQRAIREANEGDISGAMKHLRKASNHLNDAGGKIDSGLSSLDDYLKEDKVAQKMIEKGFEDEGDAENKIEKAERLLRRGDTKGAVKAMNEGIGEINDRQTHTRQGLERLKQDEEFRSDSGDDSCGPQHRHDEEYRRTSRDNYAQARNSDTSYSQGYNRGDQGNFDTSWNPYESFDPGNLNFGPINRFGPMDLLNRAPNHSDSLNGNIAGPTDIFSRLGLPTNPGDLLNGNFQSPMDMFSRLGLPTPPNPSDLLNGKLPNPLDMLSSIGLPKPPSPADLLNGNLTSPFEIAHNFGLPTPPSPTELLDVLKPPSPSDLLNGLDSIAQNPMKPIENLMKLPDPRKPKDVLKKALDPFGIFG